MIPRQEGVGLPAAATIADLLRTFRQAPHSRFPVYEGDLDNIVGVVSVKDVLYLLAEDQAAWERPLRELARPALFVPATKPIGDLFAEMRERKVQMAIVLDEYGGTAGLVTLEELVEEIVGQLSDEVATVRPAIRRVDARTVLVDAQLRVDEVNDVLGLSLPESELYETLAGLLMTRMQKIPEEGETYECKGAQIRVTRRRGARLEELEIRLPDARP